MRYAILLYGENWHLEFEDGIRPMSFYVWRCVEADSLEQAESAAMHAVMHDPCVTAGLHNPPSDPPRLRVEGVGQHGWGKLRPPGSGYIFVADGSADQESENTSLDQPARSSIVGSAGKTLARWASKVRKPPEAP